MTVDAPGFHVNVEILESAANGILQSVQDQESFELRGLCGEPELYGHDEVRTELMEFCVRWSEGLDLLTEDAELIGTALHEVAEVYDDFDQVTAKALAGDPAVPVLDEG